MSTNLRAVLVGIKRLTLVCVGAALVACGGGGSATGTPPFGGGDGATDPKASDLLVTLSAYSLQNTDGTTITATVTAVDDNRNVVANVPVSISVDAAAVVSTSGTTTADDGTIIGTVSAGADRSNRTVTITATANGLTKTASFQVFGARIVASLTGSVAPSSGPNNIVYRVSDANNNAIVGAEISVTAPGLTAATGVTDTSGSYTFSYTAPATTGALTITATGAGATDVEIVQVVAEDGSVPPAVGTVSSASLSANPDVVPVNAEGTNNQSELRALFVGADNMPITNIRARFDLNGDPNSIGGTITSGDSLLYSNANGIVTSAYRPGTRSSPTNGVSIRACWDYVDFAAPTCPNAIVANLTVTSEPLSVTIGTNGEIEEGDSNLTYIKKFVVMVVDAAGVAKSGVIVTPVLDLPAYLKGEWSIGGSGWVQGVTAGCTAEDVNRNGILESAEDINLSGMLEPRKSDASIQVVGSNTTNESGLVVLQLRYPQNVGSWDYYKITVSANGVSGTEGRASFSGVLPVAADAVSNVGASPAFQYSPYGVNGCTDPD